MKLSLLIQLCFIALCTKRGLGSEIEEFHGGKHSRGKCFEVLHQPAPNCCNQKPLFNPCSTVKCRKNKQCVLRHIPTSPPNCSDAFPLKPTCKRPCPLRKCAPYCIPTIGTNKCPSCFCEENSAFKNPCRKKGACKPNEDCVLLDVTCKRAPCYPRKKCRPTCPPEEVCPHNCLAYMDQNGCKGCHCCNGCVNKQCPDGQKCVLNQVQCITCPCPAIPQCQ